MSPSSLKKSPFLQNSSTVGGYLPLITTLFWDIGGVLLSNAWDRTERQQAIEKFGLKADEFQTRHEPLVPAFERGEITLDDYLNQTVFFSPRPFTPEEFKRYMFSLSRPNLEAIALARELRDSAKYLMGTINNESRELNEYRISRFELRGIFQSFVSSCFVGLRKPDETIYRLALDLTQRSASECCFIDDRETNLQAPARMGIQTILMKSASQLREDLLKLGVPLG
jgi:putative hydrolase of the HAD superfamily